jgi:hypothetical protein
MFGVPKYTVNSGAGKEPPACGGLKFHNHNLFTVSFQTQQMQSAVCISKCNTGVLMKKCTTSKFSYVSFNFKMKLHIYSQ